MQPKNHRWQTIRIFAVLSCVLIGCAVAVLTFFLHPSSAKAADATPAVWIGSPFSGNWPDASNCPGAQYPSPICSLPYVHHIVMIDPGTGNLDDWAADLQGVNPSTGVYLYATPQNSSQSITAKVETVGPICQSGLSAGGYRVTIAFYVGPTRIGTVSYGHINPLVTQGTTINPWGTLIGTVGGGYDTNFGCWTAPHIHIEMSSQKNYACYSNVWQPGQAISPTNQIGFIGGAYASSPRQACSQAGSISFQASGGLLYLYTTSSTNTNQGMLGGTSPSTAMLTDGSYEIAFVANTDQLFLYNNASGVSTPTYQSVASGTSPSIAGFNGGGWQVVFQGTDGNLHGWNSSGSATNYGQPMAPNTSPSIASLMAGGWRVAYQSNTNFLNLYSVSTGGSNTTNLGQGMAAHTSPSITGLNGSTWIAAFQANTGNAYVYNSAVGYGQNLNLGMAANTNPSITSLTTSTYIVALQANTGQLWIYNSANGASNTNQGMLGGTSPSISASGNSYIGAFQANTGNLFTYSPDSGATNTNQGMANGTSPAVVIPLPVH